MSVFAPEHVVVTGGAGAIGSALARVFAEGPGRPRVTVWDVDLDGAEEVADAIGGDAVRIDLTDLDALPAAFAACEPVDVFINCAGVMRVRRLEALGWSEARLMLDLDLVAPLRLMQIASRAMIERGRGWIVNVTSLAGVLPLRGCSVYGAAKAGLAMASEVARLELLPRGVQVVTVYPGAITSPLEAGARAGYAGSRLAKLLPSGRPEKLAAAVLDACVAGRARVVHPAPLGAVLRAPGAAARLMARFGPDPVA